jgi:hypothetical protein
MAGKDYALWDLQSMDGCCDAEGLKVLGNFYSAGGMTPLGSAGSFLGGEVEN